VLALVALAVSGWAIGIQVLDFILDLVF